ncbi:hypothetical protein LTR04_006419 [Oleoguttula sp. CCFEE 6159]|nr:hypothetical protein LTR04_006419 [Oleoguttula sp. CCFEE 6159]
MSDIDNDSQMHSDAESDTSDLFPGSTEDLPPSTPPHQQQYPTLISELSPPSSQDRTQGGVSLVAPIANISYPLANENGKRPLSMSEQSERFTQLQQQNINGSSTEYGRSTTMQTTQTSQTTLVEGQHDGSSSNSSMHPYTLSASGTAKNGYTWNRVEDAPGYAWKNRRAMEEAERAWATITHKDRMIKSGKGVKANADADKYGNPFEGTNRGEGPPGGQWPKTPPHEE